MMTNWFKKWTESLWVLGMFCVLTLGRVEALENWRLETELYQWRGQKSPIARWAAQGRSL